MPDFSDEKRLNVHIECYPCFLRQTALAVDLGTTDEALKMHIMKAVLRDMEGADMHKTPAHATTGMHRIIRQMLGCDPFEGIKQEYNKKALELYPSLKETVRNSDDPLHTASRLAVAGNVIDFGIYTSVDIEGTVERSLNEPFAVEDYQRFKDEMDRADNVLYLLDNAGEVVFDRLLIEELLERGREVVAVVKGSPVINDCTMIDAEGAGLAGVCEVMDNGSDAVGTILETTSPAFNDVFNDNSSLVISKGQGNFETLMGERKNMFFLFQSKCGVLSRFLGLETGSMLLAENSK
jgi:uncharacterized protein with ATP-grasp and redox domains